MHFGGGQDKDHVLRRFLQRFQQGVERADRKHVDFIDNVYPVFCGGGRKIRFFTQGADILYTVVAGGVDLHYIHHGAVVETAADFAFSARVAVLRIQAVDRLGQNFGAGGFAGSP